jgi:hypothetical protein
MENKKFKRIHLDKFVAGNEQRIFKTKTNVVDNFVNPTNQFKSHNVFYGEYSSSKTNNSNIQLNGLLSGDLINFHNINSNYVTNNPEKEYILNLQDTNLPEFNLLASEAELDTNKNKEEVITYFPKYIHTPIDIAYSENNSYFLLPLNTNKYVNLKQSNNTINLNKFEYEATYKPNYGKLINHYFSKTYECPEDNSVPIYDLNFSFMETLNLNSHFNAVNFLEKHNLYNLKLYDSPNSSFLLRDKILFNSKTNKLDADNGDSIHIKNLITNMIEYPNLFSLDDRKNIIYDLVIQLNINSSIRTLQPVRTNYTFSIRNY